MRPGTSGGACTASSAGVTGSASRGDLRERGVETGAILLAPFLDDPTGVGCGDDLKMVDELVRSGVPLSEMWSEASALLADPTFRARARTLEFALLSLPELDADEVERLLT